MEILILIIKLIVALVSPFIYGWLTQKVMDDKNYDENWFWWGFFFGFIALAIAIMRPTIREADYIKNAPEWMQQDREAEPNYEILNKGGWECQCGRINASYVGVCACGTSRDEMNQMARKEREN